MLKSMVSSALAVAAAFGATTAAQAQTQAEPFVALSAGYHTIDAGDDDLGVDDPSSPIIGAVVGVDVPMGASAFVGAEGNYHFGTDDINSEYGAAVRLGTRMSPTSKIYVKGGYQEVDFDTKKWLGVTPPAGVDTTDGGWLAGLGADFDMGPRSALRLNADTIEFDSARLTAGVAFKF